MKVVGYIRVSDHKQQKFGQSLDEQENRIRAYCTDRGLELVEIFTDVLSGKAADAREALHRALDAVKAKKAEGLIITRLDRFARNLRELLFLIDDHFIKTGAAFISTHDNIDMSTPLGRLSVHVLGAFAEFERAMIVERIRENMRHKQRKHEYVGGLVPFGYKVGDDGKSLVEIPEEQEVIKLVYELRLLKGLSYGRIEDELARRGLKRRGGTRIDKKACQRMVDMFEREMEDKQWRTRQ